MKMYAYVQKFRGYAESDMRHGLVWYDRDGLDMPRVEEQDIEIKKDIILMSSFDCMMCNRIEELPVTVKTVDGKIVCRDCREKMRQFEEEAK
jgi:hypothetical protein